MRREPISGGTEIICRNVVDVAKCLVDERRNVRVEESVHDVATTSISDDEPKVTQHPQLM